MQTVVIYARVNYGRRISQIWFNGHACVHHICRSYDDESEVCKSFVSILQVVRLVYHTRLKLRVNELLSEVGFTASATHW